MMLYGLGAMNAFRLIYEVDLVVVHVVQPRLDNLSRWEIPAEELIRWGEETVKPAAQKAFEGV